MSHIIYLTTGQAPVTAGETAHSQRWLLDSGTGKASRLSYGVEPWRPNANTAT